MFNEVYRRALERGVETLGSEDALANHLGVPTIALRAWLNRAAACPTAVFLRVVDLLLEGSSETLKDAAPARDGSTRQQPNQA